MSQPTASAVFTVDELWLLQSAIRHEIAQIDGWHAPPASLALNNQIADALVLCEENGLSEAALLLTRGDCLAIDYNVPQTAKSPAGLAIGKSVLMKSFRTRQEIDEGRAPMAAPHDELDREEVAKRIEAWKSRRRRKRSS